MDLYGEHVGTRIWEVVCSPRVQGGLQFVGGVTEAFIGAGMAYFSAGIAAPLGWGVMAHGLDHAMTGIRTCVSGEFTDSATTQLLEKAGMSHNLATCSDSVMSLGGSMGGIAALRNAARSSFPAFHLPKETFTSNSGQQSILKSPVASGGRNRLIPDPNATGAHTVFRRDPTTGLVTHYETFQFQTNVYDPKMWESVKRFDAIGRKHTNKILKLDIQTPHIHDKTFPGGVRHPESWEVPTCYE